MIVLGICTGTIIWAAAGFYGIVYLFTTAPWIYSILKILGGSYIVYLGVVLIKNLLTNTSKSIIIKNNSLSYFSCWARGLLTNLSNPKTAMFITSLFASILPKNPTIFMGMLTITLMTAISMAWYLLVIFMFSSEKFSTYYNHIKKWIEGYKEMDRRIYRNCFCSLWHKMDLG